MTQEFFATPATEQPEMFAAADAAALQPAWWHHAILPVSLAVSAALLWAQWRRRGRSGRK